MLNIGFGPRLMSLGFVVCLVFGPIFFQIMEVENGLNRSWFKVC